MGRRFLLVCGVLSPILYALADALAGLRLEGYSFRDQTISELGAIGAPSRPLFSALLVLAYLLLVAFGVGVRRFDPSSRLLRVAGALIVGLGVLAIAVGQLVSMRPRGADQGLAGTLHLAEGAVAMALVFAVMGLSAAAVGRRFRLYTIAVIVGMVVFGAWSAMDIPRVEAGLVTPWGGVKERIWWYGYQSWFAILALTLLRRDRPEALDGSR